LDCDPPGPDQGAADPVVELPLRSEGAACAVASFFIARLKAFQRRPCSFAYRSWTRWRASAAMLVCRSTKTPIQKEVSGGKRLARERAMA
jgi:hypothetical protein